MGIIGRKEGIEHVDTCVIVRMITRDNEKMLKKARKLFSHTNKLYVFEDAAMMEVVYVLSTSLYKYTRELIAQKIKSIMQIIINI
jgi:predicted nucleic-acid-binding protein